MKKNYLSGLIILITLVLVGYMVVDSKKEDMGYIMVENTESKSIDKDLIDNFMSDVENSYNKNKKEIGKIEKVENVENVENKEDIKINKNKEDKKDNNKKPIEYKNNINKNKENITNLKENKNIDKVFKVDKDLIVGMLTFKEKKDLTKIITSLSMNDYAIIIESIKNDGELECIIKINTILEESLNKEQYNLVREILEPFINLEFL